jgi:uncharacterized protein (DUF1499 family)
MKYIAPSILAALLACTASRPTNIGVGNGVLAPCPDSPNCISSQASDGKHRIEPLRYEGTEEKAKERLLAILKGIRRSNIVLDDGHYLHAEFTSALFRFVDDGEFLFNDKEKTIQIRSAARSGYYDFGVNKRRMEVIRSGLVSQP